LHRTPIHQQLDALTANLLGSMVKRCSTNHQQTAPILTKSGAVGHTNEQEPYLPPSSRPPRKSTHTCAPDPTLLPPARYLPVGPEKSERSHPSGQLRSPFELSRHIYRKKEKRDDRETKLQIAYTLHHYLLVYRDLQFSRPGWSRWRPPFQLCPQCVNKLQELSAHAQ
jgi:hypothetical protein